MADNENQEIEQDLAEKEAANSQEEETRSNAELAEEKSQEEILKEQLAQCEEKYIRVHAEFENIKKRLEREKYQAIDYASEKFAKDLIPVLDALGMAITSAQSEAPAEELLAKLLEGIELTHKQFMTMMGKHGVNEVSCDGELDPNVHEAVMQVDSADHESGHVVQVLQKGYTFKDRTLRAAMVSVAN